MWCMFILKALVYLGILEKQNNQITNFHHNYVCILSKCKFAKLHCHCDGLSACHTDVPIVNLSPFSSKLSLLLSPPPHLQLSLSTYSPPATDAQIINLSSKSPSLPLSPTLSQLCRSIGHHHHQQVFKCLDWVAAITALTIIITTVKTTSLSGVAFSPQFAFMRSNNAAGWTQL